MAQRRRRGAGGDLDLRCTCADQYAPLDGRWSARRGAAAPGALRWSRGPRVAALTLVVMVFQALLGMWTVTWLLKPIVVMAHLLGGLATFSLLPGWRGARPTCGLARWCRWSRRSARLLWIGLACSRCRSRSAAGPAPTTPALACGNDFPKCVGQWWPATISARLRALARHRGGLRRRRARRPARIAIQLAHRLIAVLVFGYLAMAGGQGLCRRAARLGRLLAGAAAARRSRSASPT